MAISLVNPSELFNTFSITDDQNRDVKNANYFTNIQSGLTRTRSVNRLQPFNSTNRINNQFQTLNRTDRVTNQIQTSQSNRIDRINENLNTLNRPERLNNQFQTLNRTDRSNNQLTTFQRSERLNDQLQLYDRTGKVNNQLSISTSEIVEKRESIRQQIFDQIYGALQSAIQQGSLSTQSDNSLATSILQADSSTDPLGLVSFYSNNPDAFDKVKNGEIPDYFNVENTGDRILNTFLSGENTEDGSFDVERARQIITQAYDEVGQMFGGKLPQLTLDTKEYVFNRLDEIAQGKVA